MNVHIQKVETPSPPPPRVWTSTDLIKWTKDFFARKGIESARLEAELLLADVLGCTKIRLYADFEKPVAADKLALYRERVKRRAETREPIQYILGHTDFIDLRIKVNRAVLIPRPETELLAVWAVEKVLGPRAKLVNRSEKTKVVELPKPGEAASVAAEEPPPAPTPIPVASNDPVRVLDLCTGSGCLALYVVSKDARVQATATDISQDALAVARENAVTLKLDSRVRFLNGDLFAALPENERGTFDLITANPPYIDPATRETLQIEVRDHEPPSALFAEDAGTAISKRIIAEAQQWLKPGGWLGLEFGVGQAETLKSAALGAGWQDVEIRIDHAGLPRFVIARKR